MKTDVFIFSIKEEIFIKYMEILEKSYQYHQKQN